MNPSSPRLLVSVRSRDEAMLARDAGADIIDLKDPIRGPLEPVDVEIMRQILSDARLREHPITIALGEAIHFSSLPNLSSPPMLFKLGMAGMRSHPSGREMFLAHAELARDQAHRPILIPAAYADADRTDAPPWREVLDWAVQARSPFFLVDTGIKDGTNFCDWIETEEYRELRKATRAAQLPLAVAGALNEEAIEKLLVDPPDVVAVRGAACVRQERKAALSPERIHALRELLRSANLTRS